MNQRKLSNLEIRGAFQEAFPIIIEKINEFKEERAA